MSAPTVLCEGGHLASAQNIPALTSYYGFWGHGRDPAATAVTTEANVTANVRANGTVTHFTAGVDAALGAAFTAFVSKNSSPSPVSISIGLTVGYITDISDSASYSTVTPDTGDFGFSTGSGNASFSGNFYSLTAAFTPTSPGSQMLGAVGPQSITPGASTQKYQCPVGLLGTTAGITEAQAQIQALMSFTWQYLQAHCSVSTLLASHPVAVTTRIGGASGNQALSVQAVGFYEDINDHDTVTVGSLIDYGYLGPAGETGAFTLDWLGGWIFPNSVQLCKIGSGSATAGTIASSSQSYSGLFGGTSLGNTLATSNRARGLMPYACTASLFTIYLSTNTCASLTIGPLKNGNASGCAVSPSSGTTGQIQDLTGTASFNAGDELVDYINNASTGSANLFSSILLLTSQSAGPEQLTTLGAG